MFNKKRVSTIDGFTDSVAYELPTECPMCHCHSIPAEVGSVIDDVQNMQMSVFYLCPNCLSSFITRYVITDHPSDLFPGYDKAVSLRSEPQSPKPVNLPIHIKNLSERFCNIYNQALQAEAMRLDELTGMGLRKSLEFLVKDFAVHFHSDQEESIKKMSLSNCIQTFMPDNMKALATAATWLGNDETHYVKKYEMQDLKSLKAYLNAFIHYAESELVNEEAFAFVSSSKKN